MCSFFAISTVVAVNTFARNMSCFNVCKRLKNHSTKLSEVEMVLIIHHHHLHLFLYQCFHMFQQPKYQSCPRSPFPFVKAYTHTNRIPQPLCHVQQRMSWDMQSQVGSSANRRITTGLKCTKGREKKLGKCPQEHTYAFFFFLLLLHFSRSSTCCC